MATRQHLLAVLLCCCALPAGLATARQTLDLAPFARVVGSDPARKEGARAGRLEEFRAEDVFLSEPLAALKTGEYQVPVSKDNRACVGLEWAERRLLTELSIQFRAEVEVPPQDRVHVQYWSSAGRKDSWDGIGQTPWQGQWEPLPGDLRRQDNGWTLHISKAKVPEFADGSGTLKVRWIFDGVDRNIVVKQLSAMGESATAVGEFRFEMDPRLAPAAAGLSMYNGRFADFTDGSARFEQAWAAATAKTYRLVYTVPKPAKADRTLIRVTLPNGGFSVAVEDLLANECVYVKDYGVLVSRADVPVTLVQYREKIASRKTILQQVREAPDQTFEAAWKALRRPIQDNGPTMFSLPCDNAKFIVERDGTIRYGKFAVVPTFGNRRTKLDRLEWGKIGLDTAVVPPTAEKGLPMRIKDTISEKGLGLHAHAQFSVELNGEYEAFESQIGVQWREGNNCGTVIFQIDVDGKRVFDSGPMKQTDAARPVRMTLAGAQRMTLIADTGDTIECAAANWANARLIRAPSASEGPATTRPAHEYLSDLYTRDERQKSQIRRTIWQHRPAEQEQGTTLVRFATAGSFAPILLNCFSQREAQVGWEIGVTRDAGHGALCAVSFAASYTEPNVPSGQFTISFLADAEKGEPADLRADAQAITAHRGDRVLARISRLNLPEDSFSLDSGKLHFKHLPANQEFSLLIPNWEATSKDAPNEFTPHHTEAWLGAWDGLLGKDFHHRSPRNQFARIHLPEPMLIDVTTASQFHILMAARTAPDGKSIEPWIASNTYGPLDTEAQAVILGMDLFGHHDFARRCHEFFISSYNPDGLLAKGYTLMGTGQHLWTLAEHVKLTGNTEWFEKIAPQVLRPCDWIKRQLEKTKRNDPAGVPLPESGLMPPGVLADWNRYAYCFYANAHFYAGLHGIADCLARIHHPRAAEITKLADEYRGHILAAWKWQQARMPVLPLRDGAWVPATPSSLYCYGLTRDFYGGVSATGHDVEVGGNHLIPLGLIAPHSREADWIADYYEDRWFLIDGIFGAYPAAENEADPFNRGGFAKLQPHYARTSDMHALRDDVKPFIRTYFNTFPVLLNTENLTFWEHMNNGGAWNKTHESAWFLQMTRTMLVQERGDELWLAPFVTNNWLKPGTGVKVQNAPTYFGTVSYELKPSADGNVIEADITPPGRSAPKSIVLRIRHPEGKRIRKVLVDDASWEDFDAIKETVRLAPSARPIRVRAEY